ncbi:UPF0235 protein C15orf40 homolog [Ornithodoros turicata]|uniref:UPF0235 protein C15orf40 homolog n=1 Tax=Ornithodoros turicata TaxID=34597 RepID=UPI003138E683
MHYRLLQYCSRRTYLTQKLSMPKAKKDQNKPQATTAKNAAAQQNEPVYATSTGCVAIRIHAKPGAKESSITDIAADAVGVQIGAPPTDGEANSELVKFLAKVLNVRRRDVSLEKGSRSKDKVVFVLSSTSVDQVLQQLQAAIGK